MIWLGVHGIGWYDQWAHEREPPSAHAKPYIRIAIVTKSMNEEPDKGFYELHKNHYQAPRSGSICDDGENDGGYTVFECFASVRMRSLAGKVLTLDSGFP